MKRIVHNRRLHSRTGPQLDALKAIAPIPQIVDNPRRKRICLTEAAMEKTERQPLPQSYTGHVENGVIVLDAPIRLPEGQAVRVEPLNVVLTESDRSDRVRQLKQLFHQWTEEDSNLSEEEADRLRVALEENRGLRFRSPDLD
jgi:hypothetical protein